MVTITLGITFSTGCTSSAQFSMTARRSSSSVWVYSTSLTSLLSSAKQNTMISRYNLRHSGNHIHVQPTIRNWCEIYHRRTCAAVGTANAPGQAAGVPGQAAGVPGQTAGVPGQTASSLRLKSSNSTKFGDMYVSFVYWSPLNIFSTCITLAGSNHTETSASQLTKYFNKASSIWHDYYTCTTFNSYMYICGFSVPCPGHRNKNKWCFQ